MPRENCQSKLSMKIENIGYSCTFQEKEKL